MSKQRVIKDDTWQDNWFFELSQVEKLVWLFVLTNPRSNIAGIYEMSSRWGATHTDTDKQTFEDILSKFVEDGKIQRIGEWVVINNHHKHQSNNTKVELGICRILEEIPPDIARLYPIHTLSIDYHTLLNSTLLNLAVGETTSPSKKKPMKPYIEPTVDLDTGDLVEQEKPQAKWHNSRKVFQVFKKELGKYPKNWDINLTQLKAGENLYTEHGIEKVEVALKYYKKHQTEEYCPDVSTPFGLDSKWDKLKSFNKRRK